MVGIMGSSSFTNLAAAVTTARNASGTFSPVFALTCINDNTKERMMIPFASVVHAKYEFGRDFGGRRLL